MQTQKLVPFSTPIWAFKTDASLEADTAVCLAMRSENTGVKKSNMGGWQSEILNEQDVKNKFPTTFKFIDAAINKVAAELNTKYKIKEAWVNLNDKNHFNYGHVHPQSTVSGCMYLKVNSTSGQIVFTNPTASVHYSLPRDIDGFWGAFNVSPTVGNLIIFPSYLEHYVEPNLSDETRVSIAFNCEALTT